MEGSISARSSTGTQPRKLRHHRRPLFLVSTSQRFQVSRWLARPRGTVTRLPGICTCNGTNPVAHRRGQCGTPGQTKRGESRFGIRQRLNSQTVLRVIAPCNYEVLIRTRKQSFPRRENLIPAPNGSTRQALRES